MWYDIYWGRVPMLPKVKKSMQARILNRQEFQNQFNTYLTQATNIFRWNGLPKTCDARMLERMLILNGTAVMVKINGAYLTLGAAPGFNLNVYGYPTKVWGWGYNGFNREFKAYVPGADGSRELVKSASGIIADSEPDAVICYDNAEAYPFVTYIIAAARRISDTLRAADVAVKTMKSPFLITAEENTVKGITEIVERYEDNNFVIIPTKGFSPDSLKVWPTQTNPQLLDAYWQYKCNVADDLSYQLGLPNNPQADKHERLIVDEVNANNTSTDLNLQKRLEWRNKFCDWVNDLWGLSVSVEVNMEEKDVLGLYGDGTGENPGGDAGDSNAGGAIPRD